MAADRAALWFQPWRQMQLHKPGKSWLWLWLDSVTFHCFIFPKPKEHQSCPQSHWFVPTLPSSFQMARCIPGILSHCKTCATKDFSVFAKGSMLARRIRKSTLIQPLFSSFQWPKIRSWSLDKSVPWSIKWRCWAMLFLSRFFQIDCGTTIHRAYGSFPSLEVTVVATSQCLTEVTKTFETDTLFERSSCLQKGKRNRHCLAIVSSLSSLPGLVGTLLVKLYARVLPCEKLRSSKEHWCSRSCSCVRYFCIEFMWRSPLYHNWHQNKGSVEQTIHDESHLFEVLLEWDRIWILNFNISLASNLTQIFWPSLSIWDPSHRATLKPYL